MKKPEFPKPRIIREDFLPNEPMKNYRIKKVTENGETFYYPQRKILWWWEDIFGLSRYNFLGHFPTLEEAKQALHIVICIEKKYLGEPVVEYLDFDPIEDCKK